MTHILENPVASRVSRDLYTSRETRSNCEILGSKLDSLIELRARNVLSVASNVTLLATDNTNCR